MHEQKGRHSRARVSNGAGQLDQVRVVTATASKEESKHRPRFIFVWRVELGEVRRSGVRDNRLDIA